MELSETVRLMQRKGLLTFREREAIFYASDETPSEVKALARQFKDELNRRGPVAKREAGK